jgi:hypothetical protein
MGINRVQNKKCGKKPIIIAALHGSYPPNNAVPRITCIIGKCQFNHLPLMPSTVIMLQDEGWTQTGGQKGMGTYM